MDTSINNKSSIQPKTMAELLPEISCILTEDSIRYLRAKERPRSTIAQTRTDEKVRKPLTIAQMSANIVSLRQPSPRRLVQLNTSTRRKKWNPSVKLETKTKCVTANGKIKHTSVRKVLNFEPKMKPVASVRSTLISSETPTYPNSELRANKSSHWHARNGVRVSGVFNIPPTPVLQNQPKPRIIMQNNNTENRPYRANINRKTVLTHRNVIQKKFKPPGTETPISNLSITSNSDASFLRNEQEIDLEEKTKMEIDCQSLDKIVEVTPIVSTQFKKYRNVEEYFNITCDIDNTCNNNTITCLDKVSCNKENSKKEKSVIVSLCEMMNTAFTNTELDDLLQVENQTENNIKMIENGIRTLTNIKESQFKLLQCVRKMINEKRNKEVKIEMNLDHIEIETPVKMLSPRRRPSVIKTKSPSFKIPRMNTCRRKKVAFKSMPNISEGMQAPVESEDTVWDIYMQIKENMNFLNTPIVKHRLVEPQDSLTVTSPNLQK